MQAGFTDELIWVSRARSTSLYRRMLRQKVSAAAVAIRGKDEQPMGAARLEGPVSLPSNYGTTCLVVSSSDSFLL